jgi:hypothetical protein
MESCSRNFVSLVEDALRRLNDLLYLGRHPLARLAIVEARLATAGNRTPFLHERARALGTVLCEALEALRPCVTPPPRSSVPGREWRAYLILQWAYFDGELNRNIMSRLQLSEGTFNRTRRQALQTLAAVLYEKEHGPRNWWQESPG